MKQTIIRAKELGITINDTAYILGQDPDYIKMVLQTNGELSNRMPGNMPSSYFTERLAEGLSIQEMAAELRCTRSAIYKLLRDRNISMDAYRPADPVETTTE